MTGFHVHTGNSNGIPVIVVRGEVDIATSRGLEDELRSVDADRPPVVALDLRDLQFVDSTGLRLIVDFDARLRADGRQLVIVAPAPTVFRVFELTKLDSLLSFVHDLGDMTGS